MSTRTEVVEFRFITRPSVRDLALSEEVNREGAVRARQEGANRWTAEPMGAMDINQNEREQIVRLTLEFDT